MLLFNMNSILQKLVQDFGNEQGIKLYNMLENKQYEEYIDIANQFKQKKLNEPIST